MKWIQPALIQPCLLVVLTGFGLAFNPVDSGPWKRFLPTGAGAQHPDVVKEPAGYVKEIRKDMGDQGKPGPGIREPGKVGIPVPVVLMD